MMDPRRLLDGDADEFECELLRSVQGDSMPTASRRRILAGIGAGGAIFTATTVAGSSALGGQFGLFKGASALAVKWIAICSVAALVPAGILATESRPSHSAVSSAPAPMTTPVTQTVAVPINDGSDVKRAFDRPAPSRAALPRESKSSPRAGAAAAAASPATLGDEVTALQVARAALASQNPSAALADLERYKVRFPSGRLSPEATVLRIEALVQRGDRSQAAALAGQFEAASPESPYSDRIQSLLGRAKAKSPR